MILSIYVSFNLPKQSQLCDVFNFLSYVSFIRSHIFLSEDVFILLLVYHPNESLLV